jgi:hypothetical protein
MIVSLVTVSPPLKCIIETICGGTHVSACACVRAHAYTCAVSVTHALVLSHTSRYAISATHKPYAPRQSCQKHRRAHICPKTQARTHLPQNTGAHTSAPTAIHAAAQRASTHRANARARVRRSQQHINTFAHVYCGEIKESKWTVAACCTSTMSKSCA